MPDVEDRVTPIKARQSLIRGEALSGSCAVCSCSSAMPSGAVIDRVTVSVVYVEQQAMTHLVFQRSLQRVVIGVDLILPISKPAIVLIQPATLPRPRSTQVVGNVNACRQVRARLAVDVLGAEQLVTRGANVIKLHHCLRHDFPLHAEV